MNARKRKESDTMANLRICPFCESDKLKIDMKKKGTRYFGIGQLEYYTASVRCNVCHARGGAVSGFVRNRRFVDKDDWLKDEISIEELERGAVEKWNTRKPMEAVAAELENIKTGGDCRHKCKYYDWSVGSCEGHCEDYVRDKAIEIVRGKE